MTISPFIMAHLKLHSKYTGFVLEKDESILTSIESFHSHLMQYFQHNDVDASVAQHNLSKAMGHLQRATLDCYKLLWLYLDQEIHELIVDPDKRLFCNYSQLPRPISLYQ